MAKIALIQEALELAGDASVIREHVALSGGSISQAARVRSERGTYLLKTGGAGLPRFFECEANGLRLLDESGAVRVPKVLAYRDGRTKNQEPRTEAGDAAGSQFSVLGSTEGFILMEWLDPPARVDRGRAGE